MASREEEKIAFPTGTNVFSSSTIGELEQNYHGECSSSFQFDELCLEVVGTKNFVAVG
jgi:hypothetical protein